MLVCLVAVPIVSEFEDAAEAASREVLQAAHDPPLGVLSLAAVLESLGIQVSIIDPDKVFYAYLAGKAFSDDFCSWITREILAQPADFFGFGSICSSYPLSIRIASAVKAARPEIPIVFGGPQASVVDAETITNFPFIDFVLRGEAERTLPLLIDELFGSQRFSQIPGLTYRSGARAIRNPNAPVIEDLDSLPYPAYHLVDHLQHSKYAALELGRGCPFACKFCSTNDFFRRRFRVKSPPRMLAEMRAIALTYGLRHFELAHDMFTVDRKRVVAFCEEMLASGDEFKWSCSARTDCVDDELLGLMARAGCTGVFFGVETGSPRMQKIIDKHLDIPKSRDMVRSAEKHGIATTVSLIMGFPEEQTADLRDTVEFFMHAVRSRTATPQLNLLAPLAATPIHLKHRHELILDELCSDCSHQGRYQNPVDRLLIETHPDLFPNFYLLPTPNLDRSYLLELREFLLTATARMRWLIAALHSASSGILDVFSEWRLHRMEIRPGLSGGDLRHYYRVRDFREDFLDLLAPRLERWPDSAVSALFDYEQALRSAPPESGLPPRPKKGLPIESIQPWDIPVRKPRVRVLHLDWDIQAVVSRVRQGEEVLEAFRRRTSYVTRPLSGESRRLVEIAPIAASVLECCDGQTNIAEMKERLRSLFETQYSEADEAFETVLRALIEHDLISVYEEASGPLSHVQPAFVTSARALVAHSGD